MFGALTFVLSLLSSPGAQAADAEDVAKFMQEYIHAVARKQPVKVAAEAVSYATVDGQDFAACAKSACEIKLRIPIEPMDWKDPEASPHPRFQVEMDVYQNQILIAARPGCYVIEKQAKQLTFDIYISECNED